MKFSCYKTDLVDAPKVVLSFNGQFDPVLVTTPDNDSFKYLASPIRA